MKRPSFQFYPGDWLRSTDLRSCSIAARGLWIEMLALMHEGDPYGHLKVGKKAIDTATLARMVGASPEDVDKCLAELAQAGVFSKTAGGILYSRRMVRDEMRRNLSAQGGSKSLINPNVPRPRYPSTYPQDHPTPPSSTPSAASAFAVASASSSQKPLQKSGNGKKDPKLCQYDQCPDLGSRTRSTTGGPWYCSKHFEEVYYPNHDSPQTPPADEQPPTKPNGSGKFDD